MSVGICVGAAMVGDANGGFPALKVCKWSALSLQEKGDCAGSSCNGWLDDGGVVESDPGRIRDSIYFRIYGRGEERGRSIADFVSMLLMCCSRAVEPRSIIHVRVRCHCLAGTMLFSYLNSPPSFDQH